MSLFQRSDRTPWFSRIFLYQRLFAPTAKAQLYGQRLPPCQANGNTGNGQTTTTPASTTTPAPASTTTPAPASGASPTPGDSVGATATLPTQTQQPGITCRPTNVKGGG